MSHQPRTPWNAIIGFSEVMETEAHGPENDHKVEEYAKDIHGGVRQLGPGSGRGFSSGELCDRLSQRPRNGKRPIPVTLHGAMRAFGPGPHPRRCSIGKAVCVGAS